MVRIINSTSVMDRIRKTVIAIIGDNVQTVDVLHTPELNFDDPKFVAPMTYKIPCYNITLEVQPETRGLPVFHIRVNFTLFANGSAGSSATEDDGKTMKARDAIHKLLNQSVNRSRLGAREAQRISDSPTIPRGNGVMARMQIEFKAFARRGEY